MRKLTVAFCDTDEVYRSRFVAYLMEHKAKEVTVCSFSEPELLLAYAGKEDYDVIILGEGCAPLEKELCQVKAPVLKLVEQLPECVAEATDYHAGPRSMMTEALKYQPVETIWHEVQVLTAGNRGNCVTGVAWKLEVIGVCSPVRHEMQLPFSLLLARVLAEKRKILYLNFMKFSGFQQSFEFCGNCDMGDVVLRLRKGTLTRETFLGSVYETEHFSYILPFFNPEQLGEFTERDFSALLNFVRRETEFETAVVDFGMGVQSLAALLDSCNSCYCPVKKGYFYEGQMEEFFRYLEKAEKKELRERLQLVELPFSAKGIRGGGKVLEQLLWSEFGDYVRNFLSGDGYGRE